MSDSSDDRDYVWHFKLSGDEMERLCADAPTDMLRRQLKALLGCVVLTHGGTDLKVTGFRLIGDPDVEHPIYPSATNGWSVAAEGPALPGEHDVSSVSGPQGGAEDASGHSPADGSAATPVPEDH